MTGLWILLICSVTINLGAAIGTEIESILGSSPRMWSKDKDRLYLRDEMYNIWAIDKYCKCGRPGFDLWVGKIPWKENDHPLQYSGLENSMDRGAWWATVHGVAKSQTQLSDFHTHTHTHTHTCTMRSREVRSIIGGGMGYLNRRDATCIPDSFLVLPELQLHSLPTFVFEMTFNESCAKQTIKWC